MDKAGKAYWDHNWQDGYLPQAVNPRVAGPNSHIYRRFHEYFRRTFSSDDTRGQALLEIGCARSAWLPYFAKEFGFKIHGIDYSEIGCQQAMQILAKEGVDGQVACADFFSPPEYMLGAFDVVVSFGVVEHFEDTTATITALSRFLKPDGIMVTIVPNLLGMSGLVQKMVNRPVFNVHVLLDRDTLAEAHRRSSLELVACDYFLFATLLVNIKNWKATFFYKGAKGLVSLLNNVMWTAEEFVSALKPNRWTSPHIICVARNRTGNLSG